MLTSVKNPRIQHIRKLQSSARARRKDGLFVVEGVRLAEEVLAAERSPEYVLFTDGLSNRGQQTVDRFSSLGIDVIPVAPQVMQAASDTQTPQGILAVLPIPVGEMPSDLNFALVLDSVRDPGNLGTLLRTALAAGVDAVFLTPGSVDPFSPKVVRAGMGAHFKLPIFSLDWTAISKQLADLSIFLADIAEGVPYFDTGFETPLALVIGGEAQGAGSQAAELATSRVHIPMPGEAESLNAAIAGAILMFEVVRQRR
jgi:TrmH family RNA methyltransferase